MACCGEEEQQNPGMVKDRKCRDVLCLLFFLAFWAGMFVVCGFAAKNGNINRLIYGVDSYGFACGSRFTFQNVTIDNTQNKNLYYLNALSLLTVANIPFAKTVCLDGCPTQDNVCAFGSLPCTNNTQLFCPYRAFAQYNLSSQLPSVPPGSVSWFANLTSMAPVVDPNSTWYIQKMQALNLPWVNSWLAANNIVAGAPVGGAYYQLLSQIPGMGPCYPVWVATTPFFSRCFPSFSANWTSQVVDAAAVGAGAATVDAFKDAFNSASNQWNRYVSSISKGILIVAVGGLVGGIVLSLFWMVVLRYLAGVMAWVTILGVNVALVGLTLYSFQFAGMLDGSGVGQAISNKLPSVADPTSVDRTTWKWIAIAAAVVTGIVFLLTLLCISRIRIAVACIKVASQAVGAMPSIMLFPLIPFVFEVALVIYWIAVTAWLYSAGVLTANCRNYQASPLTFNGLGSFYNSSTYTNSTASGTFECYTNVTSTDERASLCGNDPNCYLSYNWNDRMKWAFLYHFFGLLWTNQVIVGFTCVTIAGAIASFYWAAGNTESLSVAPVVTAMKNSLVYHMGSIAFGAFIIAIIQFVKYLLEYLDRKTKSIQEGNAVAAWAMCCVKCCVCCLEKIMQFINRNAYIMVGVKGTGYCASAARALSLIVSNALRLAVVNVIGDLLLFLGKITVAATCGVIAFAISTLPYYTDPEGHPQTYIGSPVLPVALSILVGYVVAEIFFAVYEMAIDTIILSFCEDCESNGGNPKYAPELLMDVMGGKVDGGPAVAPVAK